MLIAVPGWPLPTFWTASIASTRAVSIARRSSSPKPSGRVGLRLGRAAGGGVGGGLGRGLGPGALRPCAGCSLEIGPASCGRACRAPVRTGAGPGRTVVVDVGPTRCTRGINVINPSHPRHAAPWPDGRAGYSGARSRPRFEGTPLRALLPARCRARGHPVTALSERAADPARRLPAVLRARVGAYVALTKPRIIELLLVTTVPAMMLAARGWPSLDAAAATLLGGTLAAGAANVFNCYFDRDIDRLMHRTQRRPLPIGRGHPRAALVFGIVLTVDVDRAARRDDDAAGRGARRGRDLLLRRPLHGGVQAAHPAQHRVRRRARGGAGAHRLGRGHRLARLAGGGLLRRRLLLADAALLGAGHAVPRRLRARRRPDAAGGADGAVGGPADRRLGLGDRRRLAAAVAGGGRLRHRLGLHGRRPRGSAAGSSSRRTGCCAASSAASRPGRCSCSTSRSRTWRCCRSRSSSTPSSERAPRRRRATRGCGPLSRGERLRRRLARA